MSKLKTNKEHLKELYELMELRSGLDVRIFADSDEMCTDYRHTLQKILSIKVVPWYSSDEQILITEDDILDRFNDESTTDDVHDREQEVAERYEKEVKEVIVITLEADAC